MNVAKAFHLARRMNQAWTKENLSRNNAWSFCLQRNRASPFPEVLWHFYHTKSSFACWPNGCKETFTPSQTPILHPFTKDRWRRFPSSRFLRWNTVLRIWAVDWFALCWLHKADTLWKIIHQILLHEPLNLCWLDSLVMTCWIQNIFKLNSGYSTAATRVIYIFSACSKRKRQVLMILKVTTSMKCFFPFFHLLTWNKVWVKKSMLFII